MADAPVVNQGASTGWMQLSAALLCTICGLALIPALAIAWYALLWLPGLDGLEQVGAAFLVAGPLPLALAAILSRRAARGGNSRRLIGGACFALLAIGVYAVPWTWGGRMLL